MRILVTGFTSNYGGVEALVMSYYRGMKRLDSSIVVDLLGYTVDPAYRDEVEDLGGKVYVVPSPRHAGHKRELGRFFQEHGSRYDILWCNKCDLHDIGYLRGAQGRIPRIVLHAHSSRLNYEGLRNTAFGALHRIHMEEASRCATDLWSCSDWAAKWIFPKHELGRVKFVPNAIKLDEFAFDKKARERYRRQLGLCGTVFGCVGRLNQIKNTEFALRTFQYVWERKNNSFLLVIGTGELEDHLKKVANELPCGANVIFLGMRHDVPQLLQAMDCFLMPSMFEGFPVASIEAQAAGLPVFAAADGITPQAQLTDLFHFLSLSLGPGGWAEHIISSDLTRKDRQDLLKEKGYDITVSSSRLIVELKRESSQQE